MIKEYWNLIKENKKVFIIGLIAGVIIAEIITC